MVTDMPRPLDLQKYIDKSDDLLKEIHLSMMADVSKSCNRGKTGDEALGTYKSGNLFRESIFYGGESAYIFQYRELSRLKYKNDSAWFIEKKGFSIEQAIDIIASIQTLQNEKINKVFRSFIAEGPGNWTFLPAYTFSPEEISILTGHNASLVKSILDSFVCLDGIDGFAALDDFNPTNAYPIINIADNRYLLFQYYSLVEALYETPFYWFNKDESYKNVAMQHRGEFTESFSASRLKTVFGTHRVFTNVHIYDSKQSNVGEIDVLVIFANRAIVIQAKSKKLTINARKGNVNSLQGDFKKAVQDSCNQAYSCAGFLNDENYNLVAESGDKLDIKRDYKEIYLFCVVSDHYPALSVQAREFLEFTETSTVKPPFVMDVFLLDVMTEMLRSPLHFLAYVNRRTFYGDKIMSAHELTVLSYHLKHNLWMDNKHTMMHIADDICADLDLAMLSRRDGVVGKKVPEGILTKHNDTNFSQILRDIDNLENSVALDLGFLLLSLSGDTIEMIDDGISHMAELGKKDGHHHDLTIGIDKGNTGMTIHCNNDPLIIAGPRLEEHCVKKKYASRADSWFGMCISQDESKLKLCVSLGFSWAKTDEMDKVTENLPEGQPLNGKIVDIKAAFRNGAKNGRNDKCACGSGKKFKKCCQK